MLKAKLMQLDFNKVSRLMLVKVKVSWVLLLNPYQPPKLEKNKKNKNKIWVGS